eukprot:g6388.t1
MELDAADQARVYEYFRNMQLDDEERQAEEALQRQNKYESGGFSAREEMYERSNAIRNEARNRNFSHTTPFANHYERDGGEFVGPPCGASQSHLRGSNKRIFLPPVGTGTGRPLPTQSDALDKANTFLEGREVASGGGTPATPSSSSTGPPPPPPLTNHGAHGTKSAPPGGAHLQGTNPLTDKTKPPPFPLFDFSVPFSVRAKQAAKGTLFVASSVLAGSLLGYFLSNSEAKKSQIVSDVRSGQLFREVLGVQGGGDLREDDQDLAGQGDDVDDLPFSHVETDEEVSRLLALTLISDETFDKSDNLFVIVAESDRQFQDPIFKRQVRRLQKYVQRHCTAKGQREMEEEKERREKLRAAGSNANLPNPSDTKADGETPTHTPTTNAAGLFGTGIGTAIVPSPEYEESTLEKMPHQALKNKVAASLPEDISFHYTIQENLGDVPDAHKTVKFMTYRGHRKANFEWDFSTGGVKEAAGAADVAPGGDESGPEKPGSDHLSSASSNRSTSLRDLIHSKIKPFYEFVSQDDFTIIEKGIQTISARQFEQFVLEDSHDYPVVLQMYEESCFLCFLMRPMMESLARMKEFSFLDPVRFLRINVEANDFPKGLPMARGTPQFLLYREGKGDKWEEFKPNDFMSKLISELKITDADQQDALRGLADAVQKRFQLFTAVAMWQLELRKLEEELSSGGEHESTREWVGRVALKDPKDDDFPQLISALMAADMKRTDTLVENIKFLEKEAEELEKDVSLLGVMLGRAVEEGEARGEGKGRGPRFSAGEAGTATDHATASRCWSRV